MQKNTDFFLLKPCAVKRAARQTGTPALTKRTGGGSGLLEFIWIKHLALRWRHFHGTLISHTIIHRALMFPCEVLKVCGLGEVVGTAVLFTKRIR